MRLIDTVSLTAKTSNLFLSRGLNLLYFLRRCPQDFQVAGKSCFFHQFHMKGFNWRMALMVAGLRESDEIQGTLPAAAS